METKNAKIESTMLGIEDHGIMTFFLGLNYGGCGQSAGGYMLLSSKPEQDKNAFGIAIIKEILRVVGVTKWEELKGKHIRTKTDYSKVYEIGNIIEDEWLNFEEFAQKFKRE
jgi:hypothetical protein